MHAIYRNFISALRFNKTAAILNIMGLAIAYIVLQRFMHRLILPINLTGSIPKWIIFTG